MKKLLLITYYWPPAGGGGVQRPAKFCKYLPEFGWEPVVLTVDGGNVPSRDESLLADVAGVSRVHTCAAREPHALFRKLTGAREFNTAEAGSSPSRRASRSLLLGDLIRLNLFVPDSRIGWRASARRKALQVMESEKPEVVLTTAPPYTAHLIGLDLQQATGLPWIADFRDPWVEQADYNRAPRLPWVKAWNRHLERKVLERADCVLSVGEQLRNLLRSKVPNRPDHTFAVIPNGYDHEDARAARPPTDRFCLSYFGTMRRNRLFPALLEAVGEALKRPDLARDFLFRLTGNIAPDVVQAFRSALPENNLAIHGYQPHQEALDQFYEPQVLLLCIEDIPMNGLILTGKLFDYLPTGNPVLAIGPTGGDAAAVLRETRAGRMLDYGDREGMLQVLLEAYDQWRAGELQQATRSVPAYERRHQAGLLAALADQTAASSGRQP